MYDPRSLERSIRATHHFLETHEFASLEEAETALAEAITQNAIPEYQPETPLERAQDKIYDALESQSKRKRIKPAKQALEISPDCAGAYVLLVEETAATPEEARELYRAGVEAGERALGPGMFESGAGEFWSILETRPYMRALQGLVDVLVALDERDEAIPLLQRMLELNPNDNQGVRFVLLSCLIEADKLPAAHRLISRYRDDPSASWAYGRALVTCLEHGNTRHARANL